MPLSIMHKVLQKQLITAAVASLTVFCIYAFAVEGAYAASDYDNGLAAYKLRNYPLAAQYFKKAMSVSNCPPMAMLYGGHAYIGAGDKARAIEAYRKLADTYPATPEGQLGIKCLLSLAPALSSKYKLGSPPAGVAQTAAAAAAPAASSGQQPLLRRITVVPPLAGHPPVSAEMQRTVQTIVSSLPRNVYNYLDRGGATVNLAPNIEDKWPNSGDGIKPTDPSATMGEEPGRTYGHDVYLYEREKVRGANTLKDARDQSEIARICYHELGHAMDDISGVTSKTPAFMTALEADLAAMPSDVKSEHAYYCAPGEACAEVTGRILSKQDNSFTNNMPRVKALLKEKFKI